LGAESRRWVLQRHVAWFRWKGTKCLVLIFDPSSPCALPFYFTEWIEHLIQYRFIFAITAWFFDIAEQYTKYFPCLYMWLLMLISGLKETGFCMYTSKHLQDACVDAVSSWWLDAVWCFSPTHFMANLTELPFILLVSRRCKIDFGPISVCFYQILPIFTIKIISNINCRYGQFVHWMQLGFKVRKTKFWQFMLEPLVFLRLS
jgi:hypothetical protein